VEPSSRKKALTLLRRVAGEPNVALQLADCESMFELFLADDAEAPAEVVAALEDWSDISGEPAGRAVVERRHTALISFVELAEGIQVAGDGGARWPGVLWLGTRGSEQFDRIVALWRRALNEREVGQAAVRAFTSWVAMAGAASAVLDELARLTRALTATRYERRVLGELLRILSDKPQDSRPAREKATAARALLDVLER
jgi:hypothetical protein